MAPSGGGVGLLRKACQKTISSKYLLSLHNISITFEAHMITSILPAILPNVGKLVDLGFGSEAKYKIFCH